MLSKVEQLAAKLLEIEQPEVEALSETDRIVYNKLIRNGVARTHEGKIMLAAQVADDPLPSGTLFQQLTAQANKAKSPGAAVALLAERIFGVKYHNFALYGKFGNCFPTRLALVAFLLERATHSFAKNPIAELLPLAIHQSGKPTAAEIQQQQAKQNKNASRLRELAAESERFK